MGTRLPGVTTNSQQGLKMNGIRQHDVVVPRVCIKSNNQVTKKFNYLTTGPLG